MYYFTLNYQKALDAGHQPEKGFTTGKDGSLIIGWIAYNPRTKINNKTNKEEKPCRTQSA